jgi:hypothetical protein
VWKRIRRFIGKERESECPTVGSLFDIKVVTSAGNTVEIVEPNKPIDLRSKQHIAVDWVISVYESRFDGEKAKVKGDY